MIARLRVALLLTMTALAGCDLCTASTDAHRARCEQGMTDSCEWLDEHATAAGTCH